MRSLKKRYKEEVNCHNSCMREYEHNLKRGNYHSAGVFLDSASRSLIEISGIKQEMEDLQNGKVTITATILHGRNSYFN